MLQLEAIENSYYFHSYTEKSAKIIKPNRNINSNQSSEDDFIEITSTALLYKEQLQIDAFPQSFKLFDQQCLDQLTQFDADIFLVGTGHQTLFPDKAVLQYISGLNMAVDFMTTGAACTTNSSSSVRPASPSAPTTRTVT